jgi:hypothetical protein
MQKNILSVLFVLGLTFTANSMVYAQEKPSAIPDQAMILIISANDLLEKTYSEAQEACRKNSEQDQDQLLKNINEVMLQMKQTHSLIDDKDTPPRSPLLVTYIHTLTLSQGGYEMYKLPIAIPSWKNRGYVRNFPSCYTVSMLEKDVLISGKAVETAKLYRSGSQEPINDAFDGIHKINEQRRNQK